MFAYIDPGTGSMLFTVIIGLATAAFFAIKGLFVKFSFLLKGGKIDKNSIDSNKHEFVIFSDSKRYWNVFKPICDEFEKRKVGLEYWTMSEDDPALSEKYSYVHCLYIGNANSAFAKLNTMNADICLSTTPGLDVYQWKRSKNVKHYVHITHDVCAITAYRMFGVDFYDSILLPGEMLISELRAIEKLRGIPEKQVAVVGSVYMDGLKKQYGEYLKTAPQKKNEITVLVAPSWGVSSILNRFGSRLLKALKETGYNIIVRPHPQSFTSDPQLMENLMKEFPESDSFHWNRDNDNFAVMAKSDILISDFSGIIFDFVFTFGRPVIYADTNLDLSPYDDAWLKEEPWRLKILPEIGRQLKESEFDNLKSFIKNMLEDKSYEEKRNEIMDTAWKHRGESACLVTDYMLNKKKELDKEGK
ncbi:MAG: CDP-glycerol glycerophosphotransferase family protein [Sphaerochaetaceae bacterium]|nr:CDP-glycerol glycerophosphotransferase family protein [Sphaerochaetaceae bacterium]